MDHPGERCTTATTSAAPESAETTAASSPCGESAKSPRDADLPRGIAERGTYVSARLLFCACLRETRRSCLQRKT